MEFVSASSHTYTTCFGSKSTQIYVNESFNPADDATGLFTYSNVYVGSQQKADEIDRKINKALVERFGTDEPGELV